MAKVGLGSSFKNQVQQKSDRRQVEVSSISSPIKTGVGDTPVTSKTITDNGVVSTTLSLEQTSMLVSGKNSQNKQLNVDQEHQSLKFDVEVTNTNQGEHNMSLPTGIPSGLPTGIQPGATNMAFGQQGAFGSNLAVETAAQYNVVGYIAKFGNSAKPSIDVEEAKKIYNEMKISAEFTKRLADANFQLEELNESGAKTGKTVAFNDDAKKNSYSLTRFMSAAYDKYKALADASTFKVDMAKDNVEYYVLQPVVPTNAEDGTLTLNSVFCSENNTAFLKKSDVFDLMTAAVQEKFRIAGVNGAYLYVDTASKKDKAGQPITTFVLKTCSSNRNSIKLASLPIPRMALRNRQNKQATPYDASRCVNTEAFKKHYLNESIPVLPVLVMPKKDEVQEAELKRLKDAQVIAFEEQDQTLIEQWKLTVEDYKKLVKPSASTNVAKSVTQKSKSAFSLLKARVPNTKK